jgi:hypothetical protein
MISAGKKQYTTLFLLVLLIKTTSSFSQSAGYNPTSILVSQDTGCGIVYVPTAQTQCGPPIDPWNGGSSTCSLDVDGDGNIDLNLTRSESPAGQLGSSYNTVSLYASDSCYICVSATNPGWVDSLRTNDVVDSSRTWGKSGILSDSYFNQGGGSYNNGYWVNRNYIIGFKIKKANVTNYGWILNGLGRYAYTTLCTASGIHNIDAPSNIKLYPNPTQNNFTIETNTNQKQTISVFDVNGKMILSQIITGTTSIDVSNFNAGVYTISITNSAGVTNKHLVIIK